MCFSIIVTIYIRLLLRSGELILDTKVGLVSGYRLSFRLVGGELIVIILSVLFPIFSACMLCSTSDAA